MTDDEIIDKWMRKWATSDNVIELKDSIENKEAGQDALRQQRINNDDIIKRRNLFLSNGLLEKVSKHKYSKTTFFNMVLLEGGWSERKRKIKREEDLIKVSIRANNMSIRFAWVSGVFIGFGLLFQILGYRLQKEQVCIQREQVHIENKSLHKTLHDSLCTLLKQHQSWVNNHLNNECLSKFDTTYKKPQAKKF